jgi:hypothetical protein
MQNILLNDDFSKSIKKLRAILPKLSFSLLITTYLISAIIMGIFHSQNAPNIGFMIAAFLIPLAIQAGRGTLVFFFQLNPAHIQGKYSFGVIAATVLLVFSLIEAVIVLYPFGYSWIISVSSLMAIGWVIEIMILKETVFATQIELFLNKEKWQEMKEFYVAQRELKSFLGEIANGKPSALPVPEEEKEEVSPAGLDDEESIALLRELKSLLGGKEYSPSLNGQEKG